ncbi:hypothetical protein ACFL6C_12735 [Myxococcota bacterium]
MQSHNCTSPKAGDFPTQDFVTGGLRTAGKNDFGTARAILDEWPEDVFITGKGIQDLDVSDSIKAILIFEQMKRVNGSIFLRQAHAFSVADAFCSAANDKVCQELSEAWWTGLEDPKAALRIKGELSMEQALPRAHGVPSVWNGPYDLTIAEWGNGVSGRLLPRQKPDERDWSLGFDLHGFERHVGKISLESPSFCGSRDQKTNNIAVAPTELLETIVNGLQPYLPENTKNPELKKLRQQAEEAGDGSVRPAIEEIQATLDKRAEVLEQAKSNLEGATCKKVGKRTKKTLGQLADSAVEG